MNRKTRLYMTYSKEEKVNLLTIYGDPVFERDGMFVKGMHLSIFYFLFFVEDVSVNILDKQAMEERDPYLEWEDYFSISYDRKEH